MIYNTVVVDKYARHRGVDATVLQRLVEHSGVNVHSLVLEVGCGIGSYAAALASSTGCNCTGIDRSPAMLAAARERGTMVNYMQGDAESLPFPDRSFHLVFSVDVVHHVGNYQSYLSEAYWVLKKGGHFCTVTDSAETIRHRGILSTYFPETVEMELRRYPEMSALREGMSRAGFTGIREVLVETPYRETDISAYREKAFSCLHYIAEDAFQRGLQRLQQDLSANPDGLPTVARCVMLWGKKPLI